MDASMKAKLMEYLPKPKLYPFYGTLALFFLLYQPFIGYPPEIISAAFFKALPIWSLAYFVFTTARADINLLMDNDYKKFIFLGLLTSSLGDVFLVARITLFIPGMIAFGFAHVFYIMALEPSSGPSRLKTLYILGAVAVVLTMLHAIDNFLMQILVIFYISLILVMSWRATNAYERDPTFTKFVASVGAMLFVISDFMIAVDKWKFSIPFSQFFVMIFYYSAQFFIALSTDTDL